MGFIGGNGIWYDTPPVGGWGLIGVGEFEGGIDFEGSGCGGVCVCVAEGEEGEIYCRYRGCNHTDSCPVYHVECTHSPPFIILEGVTNNRG